MDVSPDGTTLGLVSGRRAWILERQTLRVLHAIDLPSPSEGARFSLDGRDLLSLRSDSGRGGSGGTTLVRIDAGTGKLSEASLPGLPVASGLAVFAVARAPR